MDRYLLDLYADPVMGWLSTVLAAMLATLSGVVLGLRFPVL